MKELDLKFDESWGKSIPDIYMEIFPWTYYDSTTILSATDETRLFQIPVGPKKSIHETNLYTCGQIDHPNYFELRKIMVMVMGGRPLPEDWLVELWIGHKLFAQLPLLLVDKKYHDIGGIILTQQLFSVLIRHPENSLTQSIFVALHGILHRGVQ